MVSHFDGDPATLVRLPLPPDLLRRLHFPGCQASFSREPTLPDERSRGIRSLGLSEPERTAYTNVITGADVNFLGVFNHHLLGYPYTLNDSPFVAGYLKAHGVADPQPVCDQRRLE
jgi:hypothetical protein